MSVSLFISVFVVASNDYGTGNGLAWLGFAPSINSNLTGLIFSIPSPPPNNVGNFLSVSPNIFFHPLLYVPILEQKDLPQLCGSLHLICGSVSFLLPAEYMVHLLHYITCAKFHHQIMHFLFLVESLFHPILYIFAHNLP
jgi:hypothetical protein